jgi:PIN domain nuclease of toxin-antitoxin system
MRILLDTHVFLWYITADVKLPSAFVAPIRNPANIVFLSVASIWEAVIKNGLGKLPLPGAPADYLALQRVAHGISSLPVEEGAMSELAGLPLLHRDPFDRVIVAQALQHQLSIATVDPAFALYAAQLLPTI